MTIDKHVPIDDFAWDDEVPATEGDPSSDDQQSPRRALLAGNGPPTDDPLVTSAQARRINGGISAMTLWRWMQDPAIGFPAPIKIRGRNYWRLSWIAQFQAARERKVR